MKNRDLDMSGLAKASPDLPRPVQEDKSLSAKQAFIFFSEITPFPFYQQSFDFLRKFAGPLPRACQIISYEQQFQHETSSILNSIFNPIHIFGTSVRFWNQFSAQSTFRKIEQCSILNSIFNQIQILGQKFEQLLQHVSEQMFLVRTIFDSGCLSGSLLARR